MQQRAETPLFCAVLPVSARSRADLGFATVLVAGRGTDPTFLTMRGSAAGPRSWVVSVALFGVLPSACSSGGGTCPLASAPTAAVVDLEDIAAPSDSPVSITVCIAGQCGTRTYDRPASGLPVLVPSVPSDSDVLVTVKIISKSRVVFSGRTRAHTYKLQPNGQGCPPTVWQVHVAAHAEHRLTSR
jgi:hypothetical protein